MFSVYLSIQFETAVTFVVSITHLTNLAQMLRAVSSREKTPQLTTTFNYVQTNGNIFFRNNR